MPRWHEVWFTFLMTTNQPPAEITVTCDHCGEQHPGNYSHEGRFGEGAIYEVVCTKDWMSDYYTAERAI